ncbi:hypothetical protein SKAU_G00273940 [Synaphobranchus kaupii]|uniref:DUF5641 domain-containing protein n=1 Tax=Synaphobranchus kaupii TaxID=118154 RepID=A0A9Q1F0U9_SYNKA|nr:hypothetical protein SKAU_G00273940 [Synaphobranchus kaupii]
MKSCATEARTSAEVRRNSGKPSRLSNQPSRSSCQSNVSFSSSIPLSPPTSVECGREIKSVKASLQVILKDHIVSEEVLSTALIEVEGILNSKPLGDLLGRRRWKQSQVLSDHFWGQFTRRYLPSLQLRQKWWNNPPDLAVGQVVMVIDAQLPRALWPIGRVTRIFTSDEGKIRSAGVDIKGSTYKRPVAKLIELPKTPDDRDSSPQ